MLFTWHSHIGTGVGRRRLVPVRGWGSRIAFSACNIRKTKRKMAVVKEWSNTIEEGGKMSLPLLSTDQGREREERGGDREREG